MHPILFDFGPIQIRFYGLMYVVAILVASRIIRSEVKRKDIALTEDEVLNLMVWCVIGGVLAARLYYVVFNWDYYSALPREIPAVWHGGLAIHGGIIGGFGAGWLYLKQWPHLKRWLSLTGWSHLFKKWLHPKEGFVSFWRMADAVAPSLIIGQAFGRFGNFMNGDAHGAPTEMPWGIVFPPGSIAGTEFPGIPTHPTMLYEMGINIIIFLFLWFWFRKRNFKNGFIFVLYLILYSCGRVFVEHFRADSLMLGPLKAAQLVSIALIIIGTGVILTRKLWKIEETND